MAGKNWDSKSRTWSGLVRPETKAKAERAALLKKQGKSIEEIAKVMNLSPSRIREYLRD